MKKLFTNDAFFAIVTWFTLVAAFPITVAVFLYYNDPMLYVCQVCRLMIAICLAVTYISYKKHSKNVMKSMMGSVLTSIVLFVGVSFFINYKDYPVSSIIAWALTLALFINHFIINSDHHSRPANIAFNQILSLIFAVLVCIESIALIPECVNTFDKIAQIITCFSQPFCIFSIVCIESRLDAYRTNREAAGWTEEAGYPENYVHEYQKKDNK